MDAHVMTAEAALVVVESLASAGVDACVGGGWAVDALLHEQTRPHADLDLWLPALQFDKAIVALTHVGVDRLFPWGDDRPWNFVLHDGGQRRVDLHLFEVRADGLLHYGGIETGESFPVAALEGVGEIDGIVVRCEAVEWLVQWHTGYDPRPCDRVDVGRLCEKFQIEMPASLR